MVTKQSDIKAIIKAYEKALKPVVPLRKILLFGSYAKGTANANSDLDLGIVVDRIPGKERVEITKELFYISWKVNTLIEPKCIYWDEYENPDQSSILYEIINTSVVY